MYERITHKLESARGTAGKFLRWGYAIVEGSTELADTTFSLLEMISTEKNLSLSNLAFPLFMGLLNGIITGVTNYSFQGRVIAENTSGDSADLSDDDDSLEEISRQRKSAYRTLTYGYLVSNLICNLLDVGLLYSASKAWSQDLRDNSDEPLALISHIEVGFILLYYCLLDLPLIFTVEIPETFRQIRKNLRIPSEEVPALQFEKRLTDLFKPIVGNASWRKAIRISACIADTGEHILPLILIMPPAWILEVMDQPVFIAAGATVAASLMIVVVTGTIFTQTYLFEGKYIEARLKAIASESDDEIPEDAPWVKASYAKVFHKLLYLGGPLHGIDIGLPILLSLREVRAPEALAQTASLIAFLISWLGSHYSEVKESQESLKKITLPDEERSQLVVRTTLPNGYNSIYSRRDRNGREGIQNLLLEEYVSPGLN